MNKQVTVVESRAIFYLLSKLRDKNTIIGENVVIKNPIILSICIYQPPNIIRYVN